MADHSKFGRRAMIRFGSFSNIQALFTDIPPPENYLPAIENAGTEIYVAHPEITQEKLLSQSA